jgi:hemolysin activation/secretion protein
VRYRLVILLSLSLGFGIAAPVAGQDKLPDEAAPATDSASTNSAPENAKAPASSSDMSDAVPDPGTIAASSGPSSTPGESNTGNDINLTPEPQAPANPLPPLPKVELNLPQEYAPVLPNLNPDQQSPLYEPIINVRKFVFKGNHVYDDSTLSGLLTKYTGRSISSEELETARQIITLYYVSHGYINSGAILPDQDPKDGVILLQVVEGRLSEVVITGNHWFQTWWLRNELRQAAGQPLNFNGLKMGMQRLRENPTVAQINAELQPRGAAGESTLKVEVKDSQPFRASLEINNNRPPSVGSTILEAHVSDLNLTGNNDPLTINYGIATLVGNSVQLDNLENAGVDYRFPVSPWRTTMEIGADRDNAGIVQAPFNQLSIQSKLTEFHVALHQPVFETPYRSLILTLQADERRNETSLFGIPFSLSPGAVNGVEQVFVTRFVQEFVDRSQVHVLSLRSQFSLGLNAFNSTVDAGGPDSHFFDWLGQAQYIRRLDDRGDLIIFRLDGQVANRPLLSLEQVQLGGVASIRGYLENQQLRDDAILSSIEFRLPLLTDKDHNGLITLAPFADFGAGWNNVNAYGPDPAATRVAGTQAVAMPSVGIGLLVTPIKYVSGEIYWGYGLNRRQVPDGTSLQNQGIEFSMTVTAF